MIFKFATTNNLLLEPEHSTNIYFKMILVEPTKYTYIPSLSIHYTTINGKEHFFNSIKEVDYATDIIINDNKDLINILYGENNE
jgi:hypothetical protein